MSDQTRGTNKQGPGTEEARERVRQGAEQGKGRVEETLADVAGATESAADDLEQRGEAQLANLARQAASQFTSLADSLQNRNADELLGDAQRLAQTNPAMFLGGSVGVGFALSRLFRSGGEGAGSHGAGAGGSSASHPRAGAPDESI